MRPTLPLAAGLATLVALVGLTPSVDTPEAEAPVPRFVNIVGACAAPNPRVAPPRITVNGVDEVVWREPSGRATSFRIEPKVAGAWPFEQAAHSANKGNGANSGRPRAQTRGGQRVQKGQVFQYNVIINCPDGSTQVIDPDIIIGEM